MRSLFSLVIASALALGFAERAEACSCARGGAVVYPGPGDPAPLNAQILVSYEHYGRPIDAKKVSLSGPGGPVRVTRVAVSSGETQAIVLRPEKPLAPKTKYAVELTYPDGKAASSKFTTGDAADTTAPTFAGVNKVSYHWSPAVCCDCSTGDPWINLLFTKATDDATPEDALVYGVWLPDASGKLDFTKPPVLYSGPSPFGRVARDELMLGHPSICAADNFPFPPGAKSLKVGVAAVDLAGNQSAPSVVSLDLSFPGTSYAGAKAKTP